MKYFISFLLSVSLLISCHTSESKYDISKYYSVQLQDSLKLEIVKYLAEAPPLNENENRFNEIFIDYYKSLYQNYSFVYFFVNENGKHFFYMLRPARSPIAKYRGVGGVFEIDSTNRVIKFKEVYNTPPYDEDYLKKIGLTLFMEFIAEGNVDIYLNIRDYIEWPDAKTYYDEVTFQWVYIDSI